MVSSYTPNKRIEKPANGDYNNTWSTPVNSDWDIIDRAFGGTTTLNAVAASGTVALTVNQYQAPIVAITGALTANVNYQLPAGVGGFWFVFNNTSGSFSILFSSAGGGSTITLAQGRTTAVICDGTNVGLADTSVPSAAGSTTQVQYNLSGQLAGSSGFVFDGANVGIGVASPPQLLAVGNTTDQFGAGISSAVTTAYFGSPSSGSGGIRRLAYDRSTGNFDFIGNTVASPLTQMTITAAGNVGIGTSAPTSLLDVNGNTEVAGTLFLGASNHGNLGSDATQLFLRGNNIALQNAAGATTYVYVNSSGNVGIGTASPGSTLTVSGTVNFTGALTSGDIPNAVGYKGIPQSTNTTAVVGDIGKHIYVSTSVTINASVFSAGDSFVIVNSNTATTSINIVAGAGVTLRLAGTTTSGTPRPILPNGMASVLCVVGGASPVFLISGAGVT